MAAKSSNDTFFERLDRTHEKTVGGYDSHPPFVLFLWILGGCLGVALATALFLTLIFAVIFYLTGTFLPGVTDTSKTWVEQRLHSTQQEVDILEAEIDDLQQEIQTLRTSQ